MEIIVLSDYILQQRANNSITESIGNAMKFTKEVVKYTKFLKEKIEQWMFVGEKAIFLNYEVQDISDADLPFENGIYLIGYNHSFDISYYNLIEDLVNHGVKLELSDYGIEWYNNR